MAEFEVGSSTRPSTPPPRAGPSNLDLTPEQVKRIEINRLKGTSRPTLSEFPPLIITTPAKAKQREREQNSSGSSYTNANNKRPLEVVPAASGSPTAPKPEARLKRDSRLGKYFDYDLSKMVNSKGGFLVEDGKDMNDELRAKERERERQRAMQALEPRESHRPLLMFSRGRMCSCFPQQGVEPEVQ